MMIFKGWLKRAMNRDDKDELVPPVWDYIPVDGEPTPEFPKPFYFASTYQVIDATHPEVYTKEDGWFYWVKHVGKQGGIPLDDPEFLEWVTAEYVEEGAKPALLEGDVVMIPEETMLDLFDIVAFIEIDRDNATLTVEGWADVITCTRNGEYCGEFYILSRDNIERGRVG